MNKMIKMVGLTLALLGVNTDIFGQTNCNLEMKGWFHHKGKQSPFIVKVSNIQCSSNFRLTGTLEPQRLKYSYIINMVPSANKYVSPSANLINNSPIKINGIDCYGVIHVRLYNNTKTFVKRDYYIDKNMNITPTLKRTIG